MLKIRIDGDGSPGQGEEPLLPDKFKNRKTKRAYQLSVDDNGHPVLPDKETLRNLSGKEAMSVVRSFLNMSYGMSHCKRLFCHIRVLTTLRTARAYGRKNKGVPWKRVAQADVLPFVDVDGVLPGGLIFNDPSRYTFEDIRSILDHWGQHHDNSFLRWTKVLREGSFTDDGIYPEDYDGRKKGGGHHRKASKKGKERAKVLASFLHVSSADVSRL